MTNKRKAARRKAVETAYKKACCDRSSQEAVKARRQREANERARRRRIRDERIKKKAAISRRSR